MNTAPRSWDAPAGPAGGVRAAGVSAFGFGGTNFHVVVEEHVPGRLPGRDRRTSVAGSVRVSASASAAEKAPLRGALVVGAAGPAAAPRDRAGPVGRPRPNRCRVDEPPDGTHGDQPRSRCRALGVDSGVNGGWRGSGHRW